MAMDLLKGETIVTSVPPGANSIKLFSEVIQIQDVKESYSQYFNVFVTYNCAKYARVLVTSKPFQQSEM